MPPEPPTKRAIAFVDGQNLYFAAKEAFGYTFPNYEPLALAQCVATSRSWTLVDTYFYTGLPDPTASPRWHHFWVAKMAAMGTRGVHTYSRPLAYSNRQVQLLLAVKG